MAAPLATVACFYSIHQANGLANANFFGSKIVTKLDE